MKVKLVSYTQSNIPGVDNLQELIAYAARVSNPSNQLNKETSQKLVRYLIEHQHWSPLEMVNACVEIETTRDIARQILRHRSFSFQEFSQRYADPTESFEFEFREARMQDKTNRQNSIAITPLDGDRALNLVDEWQNKQMRVIQAVRDAHNFAKENGIAKEQSRAVFPEGMTPSKLYMNGSIRSWVHYIALRQGNGTQKEHRDVAIACRDAIKEIIPDIEDFVKRVYNE